MKKKIIVMVLSLLLITPPYLFADWLSNWFNQYTSSGLDYYQSQKRGYVTFGSFSGRLGTTGSPLNFLSIEPPRIRVGCGGIDIFLGSLGFTNFEYLVQKLQNLIQAAPVVAFHLALQVLSSSLADTVGKVEHIIDLLNSLQLDECKLLHPFFTIDAKEMAGRTLEDRLAYIKEKIVEGYRNMWQKMKEEMENKIVTGKEAQEVVESNCPTVVKNIYLYGSVLRYIAETYGIPQDFEEIARGIVGDVVIKGYGNNTGIQYESKSPKIEPRDLRENRVIRVSVYGTTSGTEIQLTSHVSNYLLNAYNAKRGKFSPPTDYIKIAKLSPIPVEHVVNTAVLTRNPAILAGLTPAIAQGIMYNLLLDIISETTRYLTTIPEGSAEVRDCPGYTALMGEIKEMRKRALEAVDVISELYKSALAESTLSLDLASRILDYTNVVKSELERTYNFSTVTALITKSLAR